jgi:hypothetical protein
LNGRNASSTAAMTAAAAGIVPRTMAQTLQHGQAALCARISTAGAADIRARDKPTR